jgi:lipopolysaccharide/colanic/teichoic acid biosynthesis glycosyltransferase
VFHLVTVGTWLFLALARLGGAKSPTVLQSVGFWAFAIFFVCVARVSARAVCRRQIAYLQNTVVLGAGEVGQMVARKLRKHPEYGINLVGFVDAEPTPMAPDLEGLSILGLPEDLPSIVRIFDIERVVIAFSQEEHEDTLALVRKLTDYEVQVDIVPRLFEVVGPNVDIHTVEGLPLVGLPPLRLSRSSLMLKRSIDIFASVVGLLLLTPLIAAIALAIKIDSPGPIFYRGERVGRNSRRFRLFKFRTMKLEYCRGDRYGGQSAEKEFERMLGDPLLREEFETTHKVGADPRVTRLGAFLRRSSLDELPQLLNVLTGDLSLVGPRPITSDEYDLLVGKRDSGGIAARLFARENEAVPAAYPLSGYWELEDLRPGITGYWQVTGRSAIGYDERVRLDLAYVKSWSLKLDSAILAKTLRTLISSRGAY